MVIEKVGLQVIWPKEYPQFSGRPRQRLIARALAIGRNPTNVMLDESVSLRSNVLSSTNR